MRAYAIGTTFREAAMKKLILIILILSWSAQANAITIDFEEFAIGTTEPLESQGFTFTGAGSDEGFRDPARIVDIDGSNVLYVESFAGVFQATYMEIGMSRTDGEAFALYSLEFVDTGLGSFTEITAVRASDGQTIFGDLSDLGSGDWLNITSLLLTDEGLPSSQFSTFSAGAIDNIVVGAAVPIPAAAWLFFSALGLLGWLRRPI